MSGARARARASSRASGYYLVKIAVVPTAGSEHVDPFAGLLIILPHARENVAPLGVPIDAAAVRLVRAKLTWRELKDSVSKIRKRPR